jgi:allantoinase
MFGMAVARGETARVTVGSGARPETRYGLRYDRLTVKSWLRNAPGPVELAVRSRRVALPDGLRPATVHVAGGTITAVGDWDDPAAADELLDAGDQVVLPGVVDTHVHLNEPGRTEWEGFATGTAAAAAGGVTTIVEMPLNSIPATTTVAAYEQKVAAAGGQLRVDVGFWGGVVPGNAADLLPLWEAGVFGFKCFLSPSGVDEFHHVAARDLEIALPVLASVAAPLLAHAEQPAVLELAAADVAGASAQRHASWLASRPPEAESAAIALLIELARRHGARVHVVHLATADAVPLFDAARAAGVAVTVETCPHYLFFAAEDVPEGATELKCAPPLRDRSNAERLFEALAAGRIDLVASDHSPCPPALKRRREGDFSAAWGGIAALELALPALWTVAHRHGAPVERLATWLGAAPAALAGLRHKGRIAPGCDADLVVFDPDAAFVVDPEKLHQRHPVTPYAGHELRGVVETTFLRGRRVFDRGAVVGQPAGRVLRRGRDDQAKTRPAPAR